MKRTLLPLSLCLAFCGCSGLELRAVGPITDDFFKDSNKKKGYFVYEPIVVVEISDETQCLEKKGETCSKMGTPKCKVGTPFYLPNYKRPYLVNSKTGFGKAGVDVTITNGWQIGSIKDSTDNTALLPYVEKMFDRSENTKKNTQGCKAAGLYRFIGVIDTKGEQRMELKLIPIDIP